MWVQFPPSPCTTARARAGCSPFHARHQPKSSQGPEEALLFLIWDMGDNPRTWCAFLRQKIWIAPDLSS